MTGADERPSVAFLGLGLMGAPMAARLADEGLLAAVWNRSPGKGEPLRARGVIAAATPREAAEKAEVVCLCLTDANAVEAVLRGEDGLEAGLRPSALVIDFSTVGVAAGQGFAARVAAQGADWLDAPVSGGVRGAQEGTLIAFLGGSEAAIARAQPTLASVTRRATRVGEVGAGQAAKLCNQLIVSANLAAMAETFALARRLGVDAAQLTPALAGGFADSMPLQVFGPRMASGQRAPKLGSVATMLKDAEAVAASAPGLALPVLAAALERYRAAVAAGLADADLSALADLYADPAG